MSDTSNNDGKISPSTQYGVGPVPYHIHNHVDSPPVSYNDLTNLPTTGVTLGIFGNGADGAVTISSNITLTRDMFYTKLSVSSGANLYPNGFRVFASTSITVAGAIDTSGGDGATGTTATGSGLAAGGAGGTGISSGTLKQPGDGTTGGNGGYWISGTSSHGSTAGGNGTSETNGFQTNNSVGGGAGADGSGFGHGIGAAGGTLGNITQVTELDSYNYFSSMSTPFGGLGCNPTPGAGGGGGQANDSGSTRAAGGGGGGSGAPGGIMWLASPTITISTGGTLSSNGGNGGNGGVGYNAGGGTSGGDGGGGGGGNGGAIVLIYQTYTNNGTVSYSGGSGGTGANNGGTGTQGNIYKLPLTNVS